jgi:hypothetical protein
MSDAWLLTRRAVRDSPPARREHDELVIKDQRGRIQSKDSHGYDPRVEGLGDRTVE